MTEPEDIEAVLPLVERLGLKIEAVGRNGKQKPINVKELRKLYSI
jgi:hypothetical protein